MHRVSNITTLRLVYKNRPVNAVKGKKKILFVLRSIQSTGNFVMLNLVKHEVTTGLQRAKNFVLCFCIRHTWIDREQVQLNFRVIRFIVFFVRCDVWIKEEQTIEHTI